MWNRRDNETPAPSADRREMPATPAREFSAAPARTGNVVRDEGIVNIGQSIIIRGELTGNEDLTIEGKVEGKIDLKEHNLTIGPNGRIEAEITAQTVLVQGEVNGNVTARERVELAETGRVRGDIVSPRIVIADGARFKGSVDMSGGHEEKADAKADVKKDAKPAQAATVITDGPTETARAAR